MKVNFINNLRVWHGNLFEWKTALKMKIIYWKYINFPIGRKCFIVGSPTHKNIGDSAIVIAEKNFLQNCIGNKSRIKEFTVDEYSKYNNLICKFISPDCRFFGMGGVIWETNGITKNYLGKGLLEDKLTLNL